MTRTLKWLYIAALAVMAFSGFGQMPIFKRYYLSDIPGFGWAANFYTNLEVHYLAAIVLLAVVFFLVLNWLLGRRGRTRLTGMGLLRGAVLALVLVTGLFMLLKNLSSVSFSQNLVIVMNLAHLGSVMLFLFLALGCLIGRCRWLRPVDQGLQAD